MATALTSRKPIKSRRMSYNSLSRPVTCKWVFPGFQPPLWFEFHRYGRFSHIETTTFLIPTPLGPEELQSGVCCWNGCSFTSLTLTSPEFVSHVLFHPYHMYLKLVGTEVIRDRELNDCRMDSTLSNLLPSLEVQLQCCWSNGQCGVVFDSVGDFYRHVHEHASSKYLTTCHWGGMYTYCLNSHTHTHTHTHTHAYIFLPHFQAVLSMHTCNFNLILTLQESGVQCTYNIPPSFTHHIHPLIHYSQLSPLTAYH